MCGLIGACKGADSSTVDSGTSGTGGNGGTAGIAIDFGVYGAPETFFIDARGQIVHKQVGPLTEDVLHAQVAALQAGEPRP